MLGGAGAGDGAARRRPPWEEGLGGAHGYEEEEAPSRHWSSVGVRAASSSASICHVSVISSTIIGIRLLLLFINLLLQLEIGN